MNSEDFEELQTQVAAVMLLWERDIHFHLDIKTTVGLISLVQLALRHPEAAVMKQSGALKDFTMQLVERLDPEHGPLHKFLMLGFDSSADRLSEGATELDRLIVEDLLEEVDRVVAKDHLDYVAGWSTADKERLAQIVHERRVK